MFHKKVQAFLTCDVKAREHATTDDALGCFRKLATTHAILGLFPRCRVHVGPNFVQMVLDLLVDAMLEAPLDKRQLADGRAMRRGVNFVKNVSTTTKRIKEKTVLFFELVLLIQIRINNRRADLHELGTSLGKICDGPVKSAQTRTLGAFVIEGTQYIAKAIVRLEASLDDFFQKLAFAIRNAMLNLFVLVIDFDGAFFKPKGPFHVDFFRALGHLLKFEVL